jgi:hypothetical protein
VMGWTPPATRAASSARVALRPGQLRGGGVRDEAHDDRSGLLDRTSDHHQGSYRKPEGSGAPFCREGCRDSLNDLLGRSRSTETLAYFKQLAGDAEIPYQTLINFYLRECARTRKRPSMRWKTA